MARRGFARTCASSWTWVSISMCSRTARRGRTGRSGVHRLGSSGRWDRSWNAGGGRDAHDSAPRAVARPRVALWAQGNDDISARKAREALSHVLELPRRRFDWKRARHVSGAGALCASCHNGTMKPRVQWSAPPRREPGLLVFSHPTHLANAKDVACESCHSLGDPSWMNVAHATPERCISCHTHCASTHLADEAVCSTCHRTLVAATALTEARVGALPKPASHARSGLRQHARRVGAAPAANCATCHARESCQRCHVDGARAPAIRALGNRCARRAAGRGHAAVYPIPRGPSRDQFALCTARRRRRDASRCATCHARASCETCHTGEGARDVLRRLPDAREATSPGVQFVR